jgi:hypothetical protein
MFVVPAVKAEVSTRVCLADGNTPLELTDPCSHTYRPIMVGTWLTIIVKSDTDGEWPCDLGIRGDDRNYGQLLARYFNESSGHYDGSIFEAAIGKNGFVFFWNDDTTETDAFGYTGDPCAVTGDWLIFDYKATSIGDCNVGFYEFFSTDPIYELSFSHVRSRDFNKDTEVDFADFAVFASYWQVAGCNAPGWCEGTDLDIDGDVDYNDLILFVDYWLETTGHNPRPRDLDRDTKVSFTDFAILASYWQVTDCGYPGWCEGSDIDTDSDVDFNDLMLFVEFWLEGTR